MTNSLQPIWINYPRLKAALTESRRKYRAASDLMEISDTLKSLGYRHDIHDTCEAFLTHSMWLVNNGMIAHVHAFILTLIELEIVSRELSTLEQQIAETFEHYTMFWRESVSFLQRAAVFSLEDQKYWALIDVESCIRDGRFSTGVHRFHHVLVDEFQDVNPLDLNLVKAVVALNKCGLCIVGDDDQAIYEWRGASPEFILDPDSHFAETFSTHVLRINYRSPPNIVQHSQRLISHNNRRVSKMVESSSDDLAIIEVLNASSVAHSITMVTERVRHLLDDPSIGNIALIGRKRSQIIPYQIVFAGWNIPFYAAEDLHVLMSNAFEELKAILLLKSQSRQRLPLGPDPIEAILRMCDKVKRYPLSKGDRQHLREHLLSLRPKTVEQALEHLYAYTGPLKGTQNGGGMVSGFYNAIHSLLSSQTVSESLRAISEHFSGLQKDYGKSLDDIFYADPPFLYLADYANRYGDDFVQFYEDIENAISTLARVPSGDDDFSNDVDDRARRLHLMTALRAKGKEFDAVIVLDCNQGIWPSKFAKSEHDLEAERRLFYVAITRAKRQLVLVVNDEILGESTCVTPFIAESGL